MALNIGPLRTLAEQKSPSHSGPRSLGVPQQTLTGQARRARRPTWEAAAPGSVSEPVYDAVCHALVGLGAHVERGVFGAQMEVSSVNDGPFTVLLDR
jgi:D-tyrosyl-tRNA(Tyr) deacylase